MSLDARDESQADKYQGEYPQALAAIGTGRDTDETAAASGAAATATAG